MLLSGKRILVFGAGGHVGSAVARRLAAEGARLLLSGRQGAKIVNLASELNVLGVVAEPEQIDARREEEVEKYVARAAERGPIDAVFNAIGLPAGCVASFIKPSTEVTQGELGEYFDLVVRSQFLTARAAARWMQQRKGGVVIFLTATPAHGVAPFMAGHAAGHAAIEGLVRGLAAEWSPQGLRVVGVRSAGLPTSPRIQQVLGGMAAMLGLPATEMQRMAMERPALRRMPTADELARTVAFLASDYASNLTGAILNASCGELFD